MAPITISITRTIVRELPTSQSLHLASISADRSGAATATTTGAAIVVIEARPKTTKATPASSPVTFAWRISATATTQSEYVSMNDPTAMAYNQCIRSSRSSHLGGDWVEPLLRRYATADPTKSRQPSRTSAADAARDGSVCLELKFCPCRTVTVSTPITAIAISHPAMKEKARRRPLDMLSKTITVTTDNGLVTAIARPSAATSAISVPTALDHSDSGSLAQAWSELDPSAPLRPKTPRIPWSGRHGSQGEIPNLKPGGCRAGASRTPAFVAIIGRPWRRSAR